MMDKQRTVTPLMDAIFDRRSIRRYQPRSVARTVIASILEAGIWAASAHNRQPWRFFVLQDDSLKVQLASGMGERLRHDLEADQVQEAIIQKDVTRSYERLTNAPVLIVVSLSMIDMDTYPDERRAHNEYIMAVQSTAMAGQNILLAAHDNGLGACWMCAPLFCPDVVASVLGLPEDWQPQGIISMGYPAQNRTRTREPLESRVIWR